MSFKLGLVGLIFMLSFCLRPASAQVQQAWVAKYNNGITNGTHQAVKTALDTAGNIYITGFSQNTNGNIGYAILKYAPNGDLIWVSRLDSTDFTNAQPSSLALDASNNVFVTGSGGTFKYDPNGNVVWATNIYATALALDTNGNAYVTGVSNAFTTMKFGSTGSNLWTVTFAGFGLSNIAQVIVVDSQANAYVAGSATAPYEYGFPPQAPLEIFKYDSNGNEIWNAHPSSTPPQVVTIVTNGTNLYILVNYYAAGQPYNVLAYTTDGTQEWTSVIHSALVALHLE